MPPQDPAALETSAAASGVPRPALAALIAAAAAFAVFRAFQLAWVCDDSFISFRYADNLVRGLGLVYNAGEYVEGYTNLLWTLMIAAAIRLGANPIRASEVLGIGCYVVLAAILAAHARRRAAAPGAPLLPLALLLLLVMNDFHVWATGGLETMLFTLLVTAGSLATQAVSGPGGAVATGVLFGLAICTRPDGVVFAATGVAALLVVPAHVPLRRRAAHAVAAAAAVAVLVAALAAFKLSYYGELLPTAFYSKSASAAYYSQGAVYLGLFLAKNWFLVPLLLAAVVVGRGGARSASWTAGACLLGAALLFVLYVVRSGGDFMFARRLIPAVPLVLLALEDRLNAIADARLRAAVFALAVAAALLPYPVYDDARPRIAGIADERRFYPARAIDLRRLQAEAVSGTLAGTEPRIVLQGGMCSFGYFSRLPYLVEMTGLTQYSLARLPLRERGRVGHEKMPDDRWYTENRIHFILSHDFPPIPVADAKPRWDSIRFGNVAHGTIWAYDEAVMDRLRGRPGVTFTPIEEILSSAREAIVTVPPERRRAMHEFLRRFYFAGAGEKGARLDAEFRALVSTGATPAGAHTP